MSNGVQHETEAGTLIFGEQGAGKTYLLRRLAAEQLAADPKSSLIYFGPKRSAAETRAGLEGGGLGERVRAYELGAAVAAARAGLALIYGYDLADSGDHFRAVEKLIETFNTLGAIRESCQGTLVLAVDEIVAMMPAAGTGQREQFSAFVFEALSQAFDVRTRHNYLPIFTTRAAPELVEAVGGYARGVIGHFRDWRFLRDAEAVNDPFARALSGGVCTVSTSKLHVGDYIEVRSGGGECKVVRAEWARNEAE